MKRIIFIMFFLALAGVNTSADTTITVSSLDYRIYLPDDWIMKVANDSQHIFYDTSSDKVVFISIVRYHLNRTAFPGATDWQRASFIAYTLVAEYSYNPWGAILYFDSSATSRQQNYWAPELYAQYYSLDTALDSWAEYVRFTSTASCGYELFAAGDTLALAADIGLYAGIISLIQLEVSSAPIRLSHDRRAVPVAAHRRTSHPGFYTVNGRRIAGAVPRGRKRLSPAGIYLSANHTKSIVIK